jgi:sialidase-1
MIYLHWPGSVALSVALFSVGSHVARAEQVPEQVDVFTSGTEGYHTYRIPGIVRSSQDTLLAFCEGRKNSRSDHGDLDLVLRRSTDSGKTWTPMQLVYEEGGNAEITIGNPCPVVDRQTGAIWLPFCRNNDRVFITKSTDDGNTWADPVEITEHVKKPEWGWYATGPGHGIQLRSGRLVVPCDCGDSKGWGDWGKKGRSLVFFSDDHGQSWQLGGVTDAGMNECEVVQRADGSLLLSMRQYLGPKQRAFATSADRGLTWSGSRHNPQVHCPVCQSSMHRYTVQPEAAKNRILYSGPGGPGRSHMTIRLSYDEGKTWPVTKVLYEGSAAYSDLVVLPDDTIGCLYERDNYGKITFARFTLQWLTDGKDRLAGK